MQKDTTSICLKSCGKTFKDGTRALEEINLDISGGETVVLLGPSGCGKTTLLRIIAGLEEPDKGGQIIFNDEDVSKLQIEKRNVGMVFQSYALFPNMNVKENIGYGLKVRKLDKDQIDKRVSEMLEMMHITDLSIRNIDQLSGGQRQRVALARAIAVRPRVLLLDEPLTALDAILRDRLRVEIDILLRSLGITAIYVTHDQSEAMALGDRIVVMSNGKISQVGTPRKIYFNPANEFVADFIGESVLLQLENSNNGLALRGKPIKMTNPQPKGEKPHCLVIRPELLVMSNSKNNSLNDLSGIVSASVYQGESVLVMVDLGDNIKISVRLPANKSQSSNIIPDVGKPIHLGLHADDVIIVEGSIE